MDKVINDILNGISRIYDTYEEKANQRSEEERMKKGAQIDRRQKQFIDKMEKVADNLFNVIQQMDKSKQLKSNAELRDSLRVAKQCMGDINNIVKKKSLMFKVDDHLRKLAEATDQDIASIKKCLATVGETKILCCGTDGAKKFKVVMEHFKISAYQWKMLAKLQPKDSVQNFISPKFNLVDYNFVKEILRKNWPKQIQKVKVETKEVIKYVNTGNGKPSKLVQANQFIYGINREENLSYGLKIYHEQAENDDSAAAVFLGQVYEQGIFLARDLNKAVKYYQKAMKANQSYANYRFAMALIKGELSKSGMNRQDIQKGIKLLQQAATAQKPSAEAMVQLGEFYQKGHFDSDKAKTYQQPIDLKKAIAMYKKARQLHLPRASNNLGVLYINNPGMTQSNPNSKVDKSDINHENLQKGKKYLEQAQLEGFPQAFYNLGCIYESGSIGKKDLQQALLCFYNGGLKNDHLCRLKFAYQLINQTSIMKEEYEDHYRIAYRWLENIVHKINLSEENSSYSGSSGIYNIYTTQQKAEALFYLGLMHEYGFGVEKGAKKAFSFFLQSADMKYPPAKNKLGDCYFSGYGTRQDRKLAMGCYLEAADDENSQAMVNLGTIYLNGIPGMVQRNYNKAYQYFIKAMDQDNVNAMIHLSFMYKSGLGFEPNLDMAKKLLEQAAKNRSSTALYMLKEMGGDFDERVLFNNLDNQFFLAPKKINLKQIVPLISGIKL